MSFVLPGRRPEGSRFGRSTFVERHSMLAHPRALLVLQASTLVFFIYILVPLLSGGSAVLVLGLPLAGICAFWLLAQPHWGVIIVTFVMFIQYEALFGLTYLLSAMMVLPLASAAVRDRGTWLLRVPQIQIMLLIGFLFFASTLWSDFKYPITLVPEKDQTVKQAREFITQFGWLVFFLYFINTRPLLEFIANLLVVLIAAAALNGLYLFLLSGGSDRAAAAFSLAKNSNRLAYISLFATSLVWFYRSYGEKGLWRMLTFPLLFCLPLTALSAGSRSGLLQIITLGVLVLKDQKGWSPAKRMNCILAMLVVGILIFSLVPSAYLDRATSFDPSVEAPGQESLQTRHHVLGSALKMVATDPLFGAGIGNFPWVARVFFDSPGATHNSYLWAATSGGVPVLALYLLLFYITYRMLRRLETQGPRELLWLSKGLKVNLLLFLLFSAFADFWLSDFMYLIVGMTIAMTYVWRRQEHSVAAIRPHFRFTRPVNSVHVFRSAG